MCNDKFSQADGGPEVGNLQDKQYHRSCYADEVHYRQGKQESCAIAKITARCALYKYIVRRCGDMYDDLKARHWVNM